MGGRWTPAKSERRLRKRLQWPPHGATLAPGSGIGPHTGGNTMPTGIFGWLLIGLVAGVLGKIIMPGKDPGGVIVTILLGIAGALLAFYLTPMMGYDLSHA